MTKLACGSNSCHRFSEFSPSFINQNTFNGRSTDIFWAAGRQHIDQGHSIVQMLQNRHIGWLEKANAMHPR
jgi:hypothetical protein